MSELDSVKHAATPEEVRQRVQQLCDKLANSLESGDAVGKKHCNQELAQLRLMWRQMPTLFSLETIRILKDLAEKVKTTQLLAARTDVGCMQSLNIQAGGPAQVLKDTFGYTSFRPGQRELISEILAGRDAVGVMPTGAGKSLTYQIPARILPGTALVVSPLIALMKDQVDALTGVGIRATYLNSSLTSDERRARIERAAAGEFELIYAAPEGLEASIGHVLGRVNLSLIAVDEAHCISHWGHDFRPAYRNLAGLKQRFGNIPVLALTATATAEVTQDIIEQLGIDKPALYRGSFFRKNLHLHSVAKGSRQADSKKVPAVREAIARLVAEREGDCGIVYCLSRKSTEGLAEYLRQRGIRASAYHAGMESVERSQVQEAFSRDDIDVVVATIAFGMGIDKSNVRYVIHRDMPRSIEGYYQEIGRAGRDGVPSDCILFYSWAEVITYDKFAADAPEVFSERIRSQAREMFRYANESGCRHQRLVGYFGDLMPDCESSCDECSPRELFTTAPPSKVELKESSRSGMPKVKRSSLGAGRAESSEHNALFLQLKTLRRKFADEQGVPAFVVFSDATLLEMVARHPKSQSELLDVPGIGPVKLERYGKAFLELLCS